MPQNYHSIISLLWMMVSPALYTEYSIYHFRENESQIAISMLRYIPKL